MANIEELERRFKDAEEARLKIEGKKREKQFPTQPKNPLCEPIEHIISEVKKVEKLVNAIDYPLLLNRALENDAEINTLLSLNAGRLGDVHNLLNALLETLKSLRQALADQVKKQDEQRVLERDFVDKLSHYLDSLR